MPIMANKPIDALLIPLSVSHTVRVDAVKARGRPLKNPRKRIIKTSWLLYVAKEAKKLFIIIITL